MSSSFQCDTEWNKRLNSNVLLALDAGDLFRNLKKASDENSFISSLDMDILTNKMVQLEDSSYPLIEQIVYNFRHTTEASNLLPSTPHALVRTLLEANQYQQLIKILLDKINYGIFLDEYTAVLLLDHFLDNNMLDEALKIVIDLMLQEELNKPIIQQLCYYTIHQYLQSIESLTLAPLPSIEKNLDIVYRKVKYIQNPYYDDHFDLYDDQLKIGKALSTLTKNKNDVVSRGYYVLGLVLYQKFSKALNVLQNYIETVKDPHIIGKTHLEQIRSALESIEAKDEENKVEGPGHKRLIHCVPTYTTAQKELFNNQFKDIQVKLETNGKVSQEDNFKEYFNQLISEAKKEEIVLIENQKNLYAKWSDQRESMMESQIIELKSSREKLEIAKKILELKESEERLRFYEERVKMSLEISKQPPFPKVKENVAEELYVLPPGERRADRKKK